MFLWCKHSPLPSCIPAAFGNTWNHYFPTNSSRYLFICNRISRIGGGNTAVVGQSLCTTDIRLSESLQVKTPCHGNNWLLGLLALRLRTFNEDNENILWHLSVTQFCTRNCSNMSVKLQTKHSSPPVNIQLAPVSRPWATILSAPRACQATPDSTWLGT